MTTSVQTAGQASPTIQPSQLQQQQTPAAASTVDDDQKQEQPPTQEKHLPPDTNAIATISNKLPPPAADITSLSATSSDPDAPSDSVSYDDQYEGHREVKQLLESCRLLQYLDTFLNEGFDSLRSVMEVTEDDMIAMKVKRGHRRLIQREIATAKGIPRHQPLVITTISRTASAAAYPRNKSTWTPGNVSDENNSSSSGSGGGGSNATSTSGRSSGIASTPSCTSGSSSGAGVGGSTSNTSFSSTGLTSAFGSMNAGSAKQRSNSSDMVSDTLPTSTTPSSSTSVKGKQPTTQQQRAAAFNHNISTEAKPVGLPNQAASGSSNDDDEEDEEDMYEDSASSRSHSGNSKMMMMPPKRRYRRHPKPDKNAPVKPPSAYIMFSNSARTQLKDQNLSFAELAKVVGDKWKNLSMAEKQAYEHAAAEAKNEYLISLEHYRKTPEYKKYQIYLRDFRNKQDAANRLAANSIRKRSKAIASPSSGSIADSSSNGNSNGNGSSGSSGSADGFYDNGGNDSNEIESSTQPQPPSGGPRRHQHRHHRNRLGSHTPTSSNGDLLSTRRVSGADGEDSVVCDDDNMDGLSVDDTYYRLQTGLVLASGFVPTANTTHTGSSDQGYGGAQPSTPSSSTTATMSSSSVKTPSMTVIPVKMIMTAQQPSHAPQQPTADAAGKERFGQGEEHGMGEYQFLFSQGLDPVVPSNTSGRVMNDVIPIAEDAEPEDVTITDATAGSVATADDGTVAAPDSPHPPPPTTATTVADGNKDAPDATAPTAMVTDKESKSTTQKVPSTRSISPGTAASHIGQHPEKRSRCSSSNDV